MNRALLTILLLTSCSAFGQITAKIFSVDELKQFLQLSDSQVQSVLQNIDQHSQSVSEKESRVGQVQREIAVETAKDQLDPMALGVRYAEVEMLCREIRSKTGELVTRNQALLNADQKAKLKVLEDALKLGPMIQVAQIFSMLENANLSGPYLLTGSAIAAGLRASGGCSQTQLGLQIPSVNRKQIAQ